MLRKVTFTISTVLILALISWPLFTYNKALAFLNIYPDKLDSIEISHQEVVAQWQKAEPKANIDSYQNITPYWFYHWVAAAIAHDFLGIKKLNPYNNISVMAGQIAITHMRTKSVTKNTNGMLWWHILHTSLGIHIQRNWSAKDIVAKYNAISS